MCIIVLIYYIIINLFFSFFFFQTVNYLVLVGLVFFSLGEILISVGVCMNATPGPAMFAASSPAFVDPDPGRRLSK